MQDSPYLSIYQPLPMIFSCNTSFQVFLNHNTILLIHIAIPQLTSKISNPTLYHLLPHNSQHPCNYLCLSYTTQNKHHQPE